MEAIPSLCASTATCGAASIGCAYGRLDAAAVGSVRGGPDGFKPTSRSSPPTLPNISLDSPTISLRPRTLRRPQSALISPSPSLADMLDGPSRHDSGKAGHGWHAGVAAEQAGMRASEDIHGASKTSWRRRMSAIISQDGSQSTNSRPDSPAVHSNGSNAPFLPPQASTPRNKLVKRSTSLRMLNTGGFDSSPLSASQTPPLRRPITSHQRTQQFRLHQLQGNRDGNDSGDTSGCEDETPSKRSDRPHTTASPPNRSSESTWQPYFLVQTIRLIRDTPPRSATVARGSNVAENVQCMRASSSAVPALVKSTRVTKPTLLGESFRPPPLLKRPPDELDTARSSNEQPPPNPPTKIPKARNSFSFGDIMSTPPTARKLRRGSSSRKLHGQEQAPGRRIVSAPQRTLQSVDVRSQPLSHSSHTNVGHSPTHRSTSQSQEVREVSSPLPPLKRLSAFQIDLLVDDTPDPPSPDANRSSSPPPTSSSMGDPMERTGYSSIRFKPHRGSRIASDRASTTFSSEYDQSRVFSAEGDDVDYRSETVYDSIRTEATGSIHSGAKGYHAESMFGAASPEPSGLAAHTHERFASTVSIGSKGVDTLITEEEESNRTPVRASRTHIEETPTPAPRMFQLTPELGNSNQSNKYPAARPTGSLLEEDTDADDFWSTHDEPMDWEGTGVSAGKGFVGSWTDTQPGVVSSVQPQEVLPQDTEMSGFDNGFVEDNDDEDLAPSQPSIERDGRAVGRRAYLNPHLRSQSVPLQPDNTKQRFGNSTRLDAWILGGKGVSEDWDGDFDFEEPFPAVQPSDSQSTLIQKRPESGGVVVPSSILERQASVHGQFGHVKELTRLVEELRSLRSSASTHGLLQGQQSELWREAEGIIDLATLDEEVNQPPQPQSPQSTSFDFDAFDEEQSVSQLSITSQPKVEDLRSDPETHCSPEPAGLSSSPFGSRNGTPQTTRARKESVAKAKHVLEHIHQHRNTLEPLPVNEGGSPRKLPFDTTSLRDLVTRAGVVTRALREIVRRTEDPENRADGPGIRPNTPPDPPFSQIFHQPPSPPSSRRSPHTPRRRNSNSFLTGSPSAPNENDRNGSVPIMSAV